MFHLGLSLAPGYKAFGSDSEDIFTTPGLKSVHAQAASRFSLISPSAVVIDDFQRKDSLHVGEMWESLNPGYWKIENGALRRRLRNYGDRAVPIQLPWDWNLVMKNPEMISDALTRLGEYAGIARDKRLEATDPAKMTRADLLKLFPQLDYFKDPSLPEGMLWRSDWKLKGNFGLRLDAVIKGLNPGPGEDDEPAWEMFKNDFGFFGICFGGATLNESYNLLGRALVAAWFEDGRFGVFQTQLRKDRYLLRQGLRAERPFQGSAFKSLPPPKPGDRVSIEVAVTGDHPEVCTLTVQIRVGSRAAQVVCREVDRQDFTDGYLGVTCRGLLDFEIDRILLDPVQNKALLAKQNDCYVCYPLGETLKKVGGRWQVRFIALFRSDGEEAEIRVSDRELTEQGWENVPAAGSARIINNRFRRNTAVIQTFLSVSPSEKTLYYTVWKDGKNVTADPRIGTDAVGPGTGLLGRIPASGDYVGRLPRLKSPYRVCGLSCNRIYNSRSSNPKKASLPGCELIMDQPWPEAFQHFDDYGFQILLWEDDVWYLEFPIFPPSTDDCYKTITLHIAGPTTRWQMMRHWNVLNPGDHDYGVDDLQGPMQYAIRQNKDISPEFEYFRRNMQMVAHLMMGDEAPEPLDTPEFWRQWKMPDRDFSLILVDSRMWRTTQERRLWDDMGLPHVDNVFDRRSPLRSILGEKQYAWLKQTIETDTSGIICVSGINVLNTIYNQLLSREVEAERDALLFETNCPDFAGWQAYPAKHLLELFGSREGIVTVYGDLHHGGISRNVRNNVIEAHFGYIGTEGYLRAPKHGFGPRMKDFNGEEVEVIALYHQYHVSPELRPRRQREDERRDAQNFLEMIFDTDSEMPRVRMKIRNIIDSAKDEARGGGELDVPVFNTGRPLSCRFPALKTLPQADVVFYTLAGEPIRGTRSQEDGRILINGFVDVPPGTEVVMSSRNGGRVESRIIKTLPVKD